jgi:hypothetical protein
MSMVLNAIMKLDAGGFTTPLGKITQGVQTTIRLLGDMSGKITGAFDMGGMISDLAAQTGELPSTLAVLRQAFDDTGVGAQKTGQILSIMRRNMAALNDDGSVTNKMFERLGLSVDDLKTMSATEQLKAIGERINALATPAEQSAAAMEIFGRSGASMLTLLKDPAALETAAASLGGLPALLDRNANAFDGVSDAIGRIKNKSQGLWAGIAEGALPAAQSITDALDGIDLTAIGQRIGQFIGTAVELFRTAPLGQLLKDSIVVGLAETANAFASFFTEISQKFWLALSTPLSYLSAAFGKVIQEALELIGKIPKVGEKLGLKGFEAQSFSELQQQAKSDLTDYFTGVDTKIKWFDVSKEKKQISELWDFSAQIYQEKYDAVIKEANAKAKLPPGTQGFDMPGEEANAKAKLPPGTQGFDMPGEEAPAGGGAGGGIPTDTLARIGGFVGGSGDRLASLAERALDVSRRQLDELRNIRDVGGREARFA